MKEKMDFVEVPITKYFDYRKPPIGVVKIRKDALPKNPDWCLSLGYIKSKNKYEIRVISIVSDDLYGAFLKEQSKGKNENLQ